MNLGTEKEMYKPKIGYEMCGDKVFFIIPQGNYDEHRLVMTKDLFIACYEHWIKKAEDNIENPIKKVSANEISKPSDLITRKEAIEWIENWIDVNKYYHPNSKNKSIPVDEVIDRLHNVPSAEKTGEWVRNEFGSYCSSCGKYAYRDKFDKPWESEYCPYCGAKMVE